MQRQWLAMLMVPLAAAGSAYGQHALGDGRLLDNNLRVGSGGVNERAAEPDYRARNALITGDVAGFGFFRGDVGYRAPGNFGGQLGSDDLFRFRARSFGPTATSPTDLSRPGALGQFQPVEVQRTGSAAGLRDVYGVPGEPTRPLDPSGDLGSMGGTGFESRIQGSPFADDRLGYVLGRQGQVMQVTASPMLGLRQRPVRPAAIRGEEAAVQPEDSPAPTSRGPDEAPRVEGRTADLVAVDPALADLAPRFRPAVAIGREVRAAFAPERIEDPSTTLEQKVARIQAELFSPLGSQSFEAGEDVYLSLLQKIRDNRQMAAGVRPRQPDAPGVVPAEPTQPDLPAETDDAEGDDPDAFDLVAPTPEQREQARLERRRAMLVARGVDLQRLPAHDPLRAAGLVPEVEAGTDGQDGDTAADADGERPTGPFDGEDRSARPLQGPLAELVDLLDYDLPAMRTLAGDRPSRVNDLMEEAEQKLRAGEYFDAEQAYRRVLNAAPGHALARVGLVHAQLGAGLMRTAAMNLRVLFEQHPELIAARYEAPVLPPAERLRWVREELDRLIADHDRPEPPLMLAYLGYQTGSEELMRYGLDLAQARQPRDPLVPLLRRIWLDRPAADGDASPSDAAPRSSAEPAP
jgi:hypothetical protein